MFNYERRNVDGLVVGVQSSPVKIIAGDLFEVETSDYSTVGKRLVDGVYIEIMTQDESADVLNTPVIESGV